jgi:hypothetical protein
MSNYSEFVIHFHGVPFDVKCWVHSDSECDVEMTAMVESQYLYYPGSSLVPVVVDATVRTSHMVADLFPMVEAALAAA